MDEFGEGLIERVRDARAALRAAAEAGDPVAVRESLDELESALHLAREHGVEIPPAGDGTRGQARS